MISLQQETLQKIQNVQQTETSSHELYTGTIHGEPNVKDNDMKELYYNNDNNVICCNLNSSLLTEVLLR